MFGRVTDVKGYLITGELISDQRFELSPKVSFFAGDMFIVTVPAANIALQVQNEEGKFVLPFEFKIGDPLRRRIQTDAKIRIRFADQDRNDFEISDKINRFSYGGARDGGAELKAMLEGDYEITHWGYLTQTFGKSPERKFAFLEEYEIVKAVVERTGKRLPFTGGNLLGLVRNNDFIPNDYDLDAGIYFSAESPEDAGQQYGEYLAELIDSAKNSGVSVRPVNPGQLSLSSDKTEKTVYIDLLFGWYQPDDHWYRLTSFGGKLGVSAFEYETVSFFGKQVTIPAHAETELEITYGEDWRDPKPIYRPHRKEEVLRILKRFTTACAGGHANFFK